MAKKKPALTDDQVNGLLPLIHQLARKNWKSCQFLELEDLVAVGMLALAKAHSRFDPSRGIKLITFAYRAIDGAIKDEIERQLNHTTRISGEDPLILDTIPVESTLEMGSISRQMIGVLMDTLENALPDEQGLIIVRHFLEGLPFPVIARELGAPEAHIKMLYESGMTRLRKAITKT